MSEPTTKSITIFWTTFSLVLCVLMEAIIIITGINKFPGSTFMNKIGSLSAAIIALVPAVVAIKIQRISTNEKLLANWGGRTSIRLLNDYSMFITVSYSVAMAVAVAVAPR
jgi:hypothetical protein